MRENALDRAKAYAPYLTESLELFPNIAARFLSEESDVVFKDIAREIPDEISDLDEEMSILRIFKRRAHLITALADLSMDWDWAATTEHITQIADICIRRLLVCAGRQAGIDASEDNPIPGLFVLAVGKYGARELNYSSDIDFNVFYDPERIKLPNPARAERSLIKTVQCLIKGFERITGDGYIFRTDLRLRPDPRSNAVAVSTHTAERYYETLGQNWERAAMIKARFCGGDESAANQFITSVLSPFIWRRNLDYAAIEDILAIKRQIHAGKGGQHIHVPGHHLKLGKGGIREIEFYAQVQQLILGGRNSHLRTPRTVDALDALAQSDYISLDSAKALSIHYASLRDFEHRTQMIADAQTHHIPEDAVDREAFSRFCGYATLERFDENLTHILTDVHRRYVDLFPDTQPLSSREGNLVFTGVEPDPQTLETFSKLGFEGGEAVWRDMSNWLGGRIPATKTERAREYLTALAPRIIDACADTHEPDKAFAAFTRFFGVVRGGVSLLSMFNQEPQRLSYLIGLMTTSQQIAEALSEKPAILDAMADPAFLTIIPDKIAQTYEDDIYEEPDFEDKLNQARRQVHEDKFRISASVLSKRMDIDDVPGALSTMADQTIKGLLPAAIEDAQRQTGPLAGSIAVVGLGKLGGQEMRLFSDLDIMILFKAGEGDENPARQYARVTQRLISALSAVTQEGGLYEVDMALRPSGRAGPVAVSVEAFERYYREKAWTWEYMALSRARVVAASDNNFFEETSHLVAEAMSVQRTDLSTQEDIADMLKRTKTEKPPLNIWDIKNIDGGVRDIEYIAQSLCLTRRKAYHATKNKSTLAMIEAMRSCGALTKQQSKQLAGAAHFFQQFSHATGFCIGPNIPSDASKFENSAELLGFEDVNSLSDRLHLHSENVSVLVNKFIFNA